MIWHATPRVFRVFVFTLSTLGVAYQNGEWNLILFFLSTWRSAPHSLGEIYNLLFSFLTYCDIITSSVRAVRSDFVWLVIKKRAASYLRVQTHFFRQKCHQHLVTPDTVTHEHGNTVTALVVSMYVCFVVTVSSDLVLDWAEQTVWEVGFVLVWI